jgi:hypothetical protein
MSNRKELSIIRKKMKKLDEESSKRVQERIDLDIQQREIIKKILFEEKILSKIKWTVQFEYSTLSIHAWRTKITFFDKLLRIGDCYSFGLEEGISIVFHDSDINIRFDKEPNLLKFIESWELKLDLSSLKKVEGELKNELKKIKEVVKKFDKKI